MAGYLPSCCTEKNRRVEGMCINMHLTKLDNPIGGDIPGAEYAVVLWVVMDRKDKSANVVDDVFTDELEQAVRKAREIEHLDLVVFLSSKPAGFGAGADIDKVYLNTDTEATRSNLQRIVKAFHEISELSAPTVAYIHGSCLGAAYELALSCSVRVAVADSRVGLPEVKIGMIPGAGGVIRLPKLVGVAEALDVILRGSILAGKQALESNLVDILLQHRVGERGEKELVNILWDIYRGSPTIHLRRTISKKDQWLQGTLLGRHMIRSKALSAVHKKAKGHFPAPYAALNTVLQCAFASRSDDFMIEATAHMAMSSYTKAFMRLWRANRDMGKLHKERKPMSTATLPTPVYVGPARDAAILLACALKKGMFCQLCSVRPLDRLEVIGVLEDILGESRLARVLPRLQSADSYDVGGPPTSTGYGLVCVISSSSQADEVKSRFLSKLVGAPGSRWLWAYGEEFKDREPGSVRCDVHYSDVGMTADIHDANDEATNQLLEWARFVGLGIVLSPPTGVGLVDRLGHCMLSALIDVCSAGIDPSTPVLDLISTHLGIPKAAFSTGVTSVAQRVIAAAHPSDTLLAGFATTVLDKGFDHAVKRLCTGTTVVTSPEEISRDFIVGTCRAVCDIADDTTSYSFAVLDTLFVTCFSWPAQIGGPLAIMDLRYPVGDLPRKAVAGCGHLEDMLSKGVGKLLIEHPSVDSEMDRKVWEYSPIKPGAAKYAYTLGPGGRDAMLPVIFFCVWQAVLIVLHWFSTLDDARRGTRV